MKGNVNTSDGQRTLILVIVFMNPCESVIWQRVISEVFRLIAAIPTELLAMPLPLTKAERKINFIINISH